MKTMKVALRTDNTNVKDFWHYATIKEAPVCPICGMKWYVAPDGETIYCDSQHTTAELISMPTTQRVSRIEDLMVAIIEGNIDMNDEYMLDPDDATDIMNTVLDKFIFTPNRKTLDLVIKKELERLRTHG